MSRTKVGATGAPLTGLAANLIGTYANQQNSANSMDIMANQNTDPLTFNVKFLTAFEVRPVPYGRVYKMVHFELASIPVDLNET